MDHLLGVHVDIQNPRIHDSLADLFMNQPVGCFAKKEVESLDCLLVFGREYVVNTAIHSSRFRPCIESITMFYNKLPDDKFDITTTSVENLNSEVK